MAKRQHILVLCVAALLLTAGCSADDASDAAAAAAQAAATPDVPQTSTNIAQADPDGVTVAQQSNREKAAIAAAGRGGAKVKKAAAGPSPAAGGAQKEDAAAPAPPVSGKEPANFPGTVVASPVTPQTAAANSIPAVFPGGTSTSVGRAKRAAAGISNVPAAASPTDSAASPESAAAAPSGEDAKKKHKKKHKKKTAGTVEAAAAPAGADGAENDVGGSDTDDAASPAASLGGGATVATPAQMPRHAAAAATPAAAAAQKPVSASASAEAKPVGASAVAGAKTESTPVAAAATPVAVAATPAAATHGTSASAEAVTAATPAASAVAKPSDAPGSAAAAATPAAAANAKPASAVAKPGHAPGQATVEGTTSAAAGPDTAVIAKPGHAPGQAAAEGTTTAAAGPDTTAIAKPGHAPGQAAAEGITTAAAGPDTPALARPGHAPGTSAATPANPASATTEAAADAKAKPAAMQVSQVRTNFEATEPEGTMYDGQGNVVQAGVPVEGPIPAHAGTNPNAQSGQVATTDVSDRSALALDRAAVVARQAALVPAPAPSAQTAAVLSAGAPRTLLQATGGAADFGSAAQSVLSGLANSLTGSQQAASTQGAGVNAQSLGSTAQQDTPAASTQQLPQQASAAGSADPKSGALSGNTFQSSGQTSPLTPYNTAMDNSIGNMGQQLGSLIHNNGQGGTNLQRTPTIDAANSFQQPQLPANREVVHLNIPQPNLGSVGTALGRRLQDAAGELSPPQQMGYGAQSYGATTPPAGNMLQATVGKLQNAAYAIANTLQGATIANKAQPTAAATAGMQATSGAQASSVPQWSTDPSLQPASASSAADQQGASSGSAQPMAASAYNPSDVSSAAGQQGASSGSAQPTAALPYTSPVASSAAAQQDASSSSAQPMAAAVPAASAMSPMPWTSAAAGQLPLSASMQDGTSANAVADGMQRAVQNAQNIQNAQSADSATSMAAPQQQLAAGAAAPAVTSAATMAAPVQQQAAGAPAGPAVALGSSNAAPVQPAQQQSHTSTPSAPMTKIGSSQTQPMSATSGNAGGAGLINGGTPTSEQQSLGGATGMLVGMMNAGRKLSQADESQMDTVAATVAKDAKVQDAAAEVVAAAAKVSGAYWTAALSDTAAAQTVITLAVNDPTTIAATEKLEAAIIAAVKANYASVVPASITLAASSLNIAELLQFPQVQGQAISLLQAAAAATGASWEAVAQGRSAAAQSVVAKSVADPTALAAVEKLIEVVLSQSAIQGFGKSLGDLFSRRHLLDAQKTDGSLQSIVHNAVNDPSAQAAFAHVMEAAATETKAISQISGPSSAPAPGSVSGMDALSALVASVSHNALASALPGKPPSSQQQFSDWEGSLSSPSAQQAKAAAAAQDSHAVQGFDAAALGKELAQQVPALAQTVDQAASGVLLGIGRRHLSQDQSAQAQQSVDLTPAVEDLQQLGSELGTEGQEAGQAAGNAVGLTPARLASAGAQLQEGTHAALIDAAKDVVRTIGVDSDYPNFQTPGSQYGYNPVAAVIPYSGSVATAPVPGFSAMVPAIAINTAAAQQAAPIADTAAAGRKLHSDETQAQAQPQAQAQTQAQTQAQASQDTANATKNLIAGVSSLASLIRTALAPAGSAPPANAVPTMQQQSAVPQTQALASSVAAQPLASQQAVNPSTNLQSQYSTSGATSGTGGGHVGISQATTFAGENGNQISSNDIHLDGSQSNFVIGPDGKVPSLASQGGAAAVAQQEGLLVPKGAAGSQSISPSPVGYGSGYGSGSTPGYGASPTYGTSTPSYGSGYSAANSAPSYGYGSNSPPAYGSTTGTTPSYGSTTGSNTYSSTPAYGAASSSGVPGTVTAYNQGQAYGSTQQSNTSGSTVQSNNSGPSVQGSTAPYAAIVPSLQYQPAYQPQQQGMAQASFQRAMAPAPVQG